MRRALAAGLGAGLLLPALLGAASARAPVERTLLVLFDDSSVRERELLHERVGAEVTGWIPELRLTRVIVPAVAEDVYRSSELVRAVERTRTLRILGARPNDPLVDQQWGLRKIDAFRAWQLENGKDPAVPVAVIDTGVDATHEDLANRVLEGFDFLETDDDPYDDHGHGTHVAGIIAANVSNRRGVAGTSLGATVIPMKSCTSGGACPIFETYAGAIDAVRRGAQVINMSLGGPGSCTSIDQAVFDWIRDRGTLAVVAAGNSGGDGNPEITPASCDYTLAVGAVDQQGKRAAFSSYGSYVDIAAPGVEIWSTLPPLVSVASSHIGYAPLSGTSMAAPFVAAAASLVKARHPDWTPDQIERRLLSSAVDAGERGRDDRFGRGILDLRAALK